MVHLPILGILGWILLQSLTKWAVFERERERDQNGLMSTEGNGTSLIALAIGIIIGSTINTQVCQ
jgi:hypothetical protein